MKLLGKIQKKRQWLVKNSCVFCVFLSEGEFMKAVVSSNVILYLSEMHRIKLNTNMDYDSRLFLFEILAYPFIRLFFVHKSRVIVCISSFARFASFPRVARILKINQEVRIKSSFLIDPLCCHINTGGSKAYPNNGQLY